MKTCGGCSKILSLDNFHKRVLASGTVSYQSRCKECHKEYLRSWRKKKWKNDEVWREGQKLKAKSYRKSNPDFVAKIRKRARRTSKKHYFENKSSYVAKDALRRAKKLKATPDWLTEEQREFISNLYKFRSNISGVVGREYHVDHIVPLQGRNVCGLHVPWNLRVIPAEQNLSKGNSHEF
jgi:hypothetical protein